LLTFQQRFGFQVLSGFGGNESEVLLCFNLSNSEHMEFVPTVRTSRKPYQNSACWVRSNLNNSEHASPIKPKQAECVSMALARFKPQQTPPG
jgi:hypothetical protein